MPHLRVLMAIALAATLVSSGFAPAAAAEPADPAPVAALVAGAPLRLAGGDRYATSVAISEQFAPGRDAVFVATGTDFPDALAAAPAAAQLGGPLLLTHPKTLPGIVRDEITRLDPDRIYVLGMSGAVSDAVVAQLARIAPTQRIGGASRYATAIAVVDEMFGTAPSIAIATGRGFADALAAGAAAGAVGDPLLLVDGMAATLPVPTLDAIERWGVERVSIVGGHGAVDIRIEQQLRTSGLDVRRIGGATRFDTAVAVHDAYFTGNGVTSVFLATGLNFPDALSAAALAGSTTAPLLLTRPECVPPAAHQLLEQLAASLVVVGGESAVSPAAAANTACPAVPVEEQTWATTGWRIRSAAAPPYSDRPPVDVFTSTVALDETGLLVYRRRDNGQRADHPVAYAQYGISALMAYEATGDELWLDRALRHAERLAQMRTERDGAWWFPYLFPWTYYERTLTAPWWSGMAQGEALSLFVRLHDATGDAEWWTAAEQTWRSFLQPRAAGVPWSTMVDDGRLFFEEYAGNQPPLLVLNGQVFAAFGVYDYWRATGDPTARRYFDGAATTVLSIMPLVRKPSGVSYYCVQEPYCQSPLWQNSFYHGIHVWQLDTLARLTGDDAFLEWSALLTEDWQPAARLGRPPILGWEDGPPQ